MQNSTCIAFSSLEVLFCTNMIDIRLDKFQKVIDLAEFDSKMRSSLDAICKESFDYAFHIFSFLARFPRYP